MLGKYTIVSGLVFGAIALAHLLRAANQWSIQISNFDIPVWASWIVSLIAGSLCMWAFKTPQK